MSIAIIIIIIIITIIQLRIFYHSIIIIVINIIMIWVVGGDPRETVLPGRSDKTPVELPWKTW